MEILTVKNMTFSYPNTEKPAVRSASLSIESGSMNLLCGVSGCGKTTLLKLLKPAIAPVGEREGEILFCGKDVYSLSDRETASEIGFVSQNTEDAIVTDTVWRELSFGLENLSLGRDEIRRRVAETASFFGMEDIYKKKVNELSGGQRQLLSLASVMVMQPKILILDEPTSKLDPIHATDFFAAIKKINEELGVTVIIAEHRLEELFLIADKVIYMDKGEIKAVSAPKDLAAFIDRSSAIWGALPTPLRVFSSLGYVKDAPLTVNEGRSLLSKMLSSGRVTLKKKEYSHSQNKALSLSSVYFRYSKDGRDILSSAELDIYEGERFFILGGNGAGKTTLMKVMAGILKPYKGTVEIEGMKIKDAKKNGALYRNKLSYLPQDPLTLFTKTSIREDMEHLLSALSVKKEEREERINRVTERMGVTHLTERHPCDLSGGELQKCAIAKILLTEPSIILLDEPTKGLDAGSKQTLSEILSQFSSDGITSVIVSHDLELAASNADRCAILFAGEVISPDTPEEFFTKNCFYTTAASRMARGMIDGAVTADALTGACLDLKEGKL